MDVMCIQQRQGQHVLTDVEQYCVNTWTHLKQYGMVSFIHCHITTRMNELVQYAWTSACFLLYIIHYSSNFAKGKLAITQQLKGLKVIIKWILLLQSTCQLMVQLVPISQNVRKTHKQNLYREELIVSFVQN